MTDLTATARLAVNSFFTSVKSKNWNLGTTDQGHEN